MEKRIVVLILCSVLVFVGWSLISNKLYPPPPVVAKSPVPTAAPTQAAKPPDVAPTPAPTPTATPTAALQPDEPLKTTELTNENLKVVLTNKGAGIESATLNLPLKKTIELLRMFDAKYPSLAMEEINGPDKLESTHWTVRDETPGKSVTYVYKLRNGLAIEKTFTLAPKTHSVKIDFKIKNTAATEVKAQFKLHVLTGLDHDSAYQYEQKSCGVAGLLAEGKISLRSILVDEPVTARRSIEVVEPREWFGLRNRYFAGVLSSENDVSRTWLGPLEFLPTTQPLEGEKRPLKALAVDALSDGKGIAANSLFQGQFKLFIGPLKEETLGEIRQAKGHFLSYGCFGLGDLVGPLILGMMNMFYGILGNYGWAIIFTTLLIRLCVFPLTKKSQVSMMKMSQLQPKLTQLREKYADNMQKFNAEQMRLFKENGVNPLSGCLPILLQLPILAGLYSVLDISVDLRQSPFMFWMTDLSQPDRLKVFEQPINLMLFSLHELNLLPVIMTITYFFQSYLAPKPSDPAMAGQQRMMMFMPILFLFMFYSLASGLSLYFFVTSLLAMAEQKIIKTFFVPKPSQGPELTKIPKG